MTNESTETQQKKKQPMIKASLGLWAAFEKWMAVQGHQTLSEGLRAAMRQVTNFNGDCQIKNSPS